MSRRGSSGDCSRFRAVVRGVVQGVGFRPFLYRQASARGLSGWALNRGGEVLLEVQGRREAIEDFLEAVEGEAPPASAVSGIEVAGIEPRNDEDGFEIRRSRAARPRLSGLAPDLAPCGECLREIADPKARRFEYGLTSCSSCGPRYTISRDLPYDRRRTAMDDYPLCRSCLDEYGNPEDRRFHAEPLACPDCGPEVLVEDAEGLPLTGDPYARAASILFEGGVLAVKGVGGYLLCCDATEPEAVERLRAMKNRPAKPFALMAADGASAKSTASVGEAELEEMRGPRHPILLLRARPDGPVCQEVAPGMSTLGIMLPPSPLLELLAKRSPSLLVMTSANPTTSPIVADDGEARGLGADAFLFHRRKIVAPLDDSVARKLKTPRGTLNVLVRRSRGWVPGVVPASFGAPCDVLAAGGDMKATFALMRGAEILPGRPVGDLEGVDVQGAWLADLRRALATYAFRPQVLAVDMHPGYHSRRLAVRTATGARLVAVQHHHAHLAAVMVESGLGPDDSAVGLVMDGTGWGNDGTVWGGEVLLGGMCGFSREASLLQLAMPGGEAAAREPVRMAESLLLACGLPPRDERLRRIAESSRLSPKTSSAGRLIDGVAHLLGAAPAGMTYEAEAALRLESLADPTEDGAYSWTADDGVVDLRPGLLEMLEDAAAPSVAAARFHNTLADAMAAAAVAAAGPLGLPVALGGGCFANALLLRRVLAALEAAGIRALFAETLPVGDGAVAVGQAAVAAALMAEETKKGG